MPQDFSGNLTNEQKQRLVESANALRRGGILSVMGIFHQVWVERRDIFRAGALRRLPYGL